RAVRPPRHPVLERLLLLRGEASAELELREQDDRPGPHRTEGRDTGHPGKYLFWYEVVQHYAPGQGGDRHQDRLRRHTAPGDFAECCRRLTLLRQVVEH